MRVAIMQPNFIPWLGYFKLIENVELFIFLDDAEYSKNTWHNRNRLLLKDNTIYTLTLPLSNHNNNSKFNEIYLNYNALNFKKLTRLINQNFKNRNNYKIFSQIFEVLCEENLPLSELNIKIIQLMMDYLGVSVNTEKSSNLEMVGKRSERILKILKAVNATTYVSVDGAKQYMETDGFYDAFEHRVEFFQYSCNYSLERTRNADIKLSALNYILDL
jgi:hypothetical protein